MTYLGVRGCQSVPRGPECVYHGNKTDLSEWSTTAISSDSIFLFLPVVGSPCFYWRQRAKFHPSRFILESRRFNLPSGTFPLLTTFTSPALPVLITIDQVSSWMKNNDKRTSIRISQHSSLINILHSFIPPPVCQRLLLWISDATYFPWRRGGGACLLKPINDSRINARERETDQHHYCLLCKGASAECAAFKSS